MKLKEQLRGGGYINEINEFQIQLSSLSKKKSSIVGVYILIAIDFFGVHPLIYF